jgi:hypothetical protein
MTQRIERRCINLSMMAEVGMKRCENANDFQKSEEIFESMVIDNRGIRKRFEEMTLNMILYEGRLGVIDISAGECL